MGEVPESVYFFTFHKCASTLFSAYVLKNIKDLEHVDYADQIFNGTISFDEALKFEKKGMVYGPIRLSVGTVRPASRLLVQPTTQPDFIRDKIALFLIRDPRDILVSSYYSFGFSHVMSPVKEVHESQQKVREAIQKMTVDEYALSEVDKHIRKFKFLHEVSVSCERGVVLRYEDMVHDFDSFVEQLCRYVSFDRKVIEEMYRRSRPKEAEDAMAHQRSGQTQGFRNKLQPDTITALNEKLSETLNLFGYEI